MKTIEDAVQDTIASIGLDDEAIALRKAFIGLADADIKNLIRLHAALEGSGANFAKRFHENILQFPATRPFIADERVQARLQKFQEDYFNSLTAGDYGLDYIRNRLRVGLAHQRIGLETQWYLGAYSRYLVDMLAEIWQRLDREPDSFISAIESLIKIVMLDIGLAIDTYIYADRQAVQSHKAYSEQVVASIPDGLVVLNSDLSVISANKAFLKRIALEESHVTGQPVLSLISADGLRAKLDEVRHSGIDQYDLPFEMEFRHETSPMPVLVSLTNIHTPDAKAETGILVWSVYVRELAT